MNSLRRRIDRFCVLHPNFGIPNLMLYIVIGNIAFYLLSLFSSLNNTSFYSILSFSWAGLKQGQLWRLLSFSFLPTDTRPFWLLVSCYFYYWIGSTLEREWGTAKFTIYYLSGVLLTALMLWRLPVFVQLVLAAAVLFGVGAALWRSTWRALRGGSLGPDAPGLLAALILFAYSAYAAFAGLQPCFPALCGIACAQLAGKCAAQLVRGTLAAPVQRLRHLRPRTATVVRDGVQAQTDAGTLTPQDVVHILPGERIPVDGIVRSGVCTVDESALTGASQPVEKTVGDAVLAGTLDRAGSASVTPTAVGDATVLQRTIAALQRAQTVRTPEQERLERAASRMTAWLIILAAGVGAVWLFRRQPGDLTRALTCACGVLAAACPGAAGQAAGVAALAGIGRAAERGDLLMHGAEASAAQTACTVRRCGWLLLVYHAVCLPLAACGVIGPAAAAVLACGASGGVLLYALRGNGTKGERP